MKDRTQNIGWLILFLIASGFIGFISAWLFGISDLTSYMIFGLIIASGAFAICLTLYLYVRRKAEYQSLWTMLNRGCYHDVDHRIDENGKEINRLWELKMLASFHSGDLQAFDRIYKDHMNEINERKTLVSYMLCVIKDLMDATLRVKPPAVFLKNDGSKKYSYKKQREYKLYSNIEQGVKEYYGSQKQMTKIYFEQFLNHTDVLSKPLGFYLYYLMTAVMAESDHPQTEEYYRKAQQCVFDDRSLAYMEHLRSKIFIVQKGIGTQTMDKDMNQNRNNNSSFNQNDSLNHSFSLDQPAFRRDKNDQSFTQRRHSSDVQREFDEMNASLNSGNEFSPFADDNANRGNQRRMNEPLNRDNTMAQEDVSDDLDPTWFARNSLGQSADNNASQAFTQKAPSMSEPSSPFPNRQNQNMRANNSMGMNRERNQMNMPQNSAPRQIPITSDPLEDTGFQNKQTIFSDPNQNQRRTHEDPLFANRRDMTNHTSSMNFNNRNDATSMQNTGFTDTQSRQGDNRRQGFMNTQNQMRGQMGGMDPMMDDGMMDPYQQPSQRQQPVPLADLDDLPADSKKSKKKKRSSRKMKKDDAYAYDQYEDGSRDSYLDQPQFKSQGRSFTVDAHPYSTYVKHNLIIFFLSLVDLAIVSVATSSIVYTYHFERFSSVNSEMVKEIVIQALLVVAIVALLTACVHTGYTILKKSLRNWKGSLKIILSPLLLILYLVVGVICHIPYFIFACIKKGRE